MKHEHIRLIAIVLILFALFVVQWSQFSSPSSALLSDPILTSDQKHESPITKNAAQSIASSHYYHRRSLMDGLLYEHDGSQLYNSSEVRHFKYMYTRGDFTPREISHVTLLYADSAIERVFTPNPIHKDASLDVKVKLSMYTVVLIANTGPPDSSLASTDESLSVSKLLTEVEKSVRLYAQSHRVHQIVVLWQRDIKRKELFDSVKKQLGLLQHALMNPPIFSDRKSQVKQLSLTIVWNPGSSPNDILAPHSFIETECVFMLRVGTVVHPKDVDYGFLTWKWFPNLLIGFSLNTALRKFNDPYTEQCAPLMNVHKETLGIQPIKTVDFIYSAICSHRDKELAQVFQGHPFSALFSSLSVTTSGSFFHKKYLDMYTHDIPTTVHRFVNENPEMIDLAFSTMISQFTQHAPIMVKPEQTIFIPRFNRYYTNEEPTTNQDYSYLSRFLIRSFRPELSHLSDPELDLFFHFSDFKVERVQLADIT